MLCLCHYVITARWDIIACTTHFHYELKKKKVKHGKATDFQMCISGMPFELAFSIRVSTPSQLPDGMYMCEIPPNPLLFCECLPPSFFFCFFSKPTPDEMEIANRVIEFKKRKNRHITVVLICNSLIFGRLCCLHIFVCLV